MTDKEPTDEELEQTSDTLPLHERSYDLTPPEPMPNITNDDVVTNAEGVDDAGETIKTKTIEKTVDGKRVLDKHKVTTAFPTDAESVATRLPLQAKHHHGCIQCEWRNTWMCPFGFKSGQGYPVKDNSHVNGICQERINYLLSFSRGYKKSPTFAEWNKDYMLGRAGYRERKEYVTVEFIEHDLQEHLANEPANLTDDKDVEKAYDKRTKDLQFKLSGAKKDWRELWRDVVGFEDRQVDRETPKHIVHEEHKTVSLKDINKIVREFDRKEEIVDVEHEDVEVKDNVKKD